MLIPFIIVKSIIEDLCWWSSTNTTTNADSTSSTYNDGCTWNLLLWAPIVSICEFLISHYQLLMIKAACSLILALIHHVLLLAEPLAIIVALHCRLPISIVFILVNSNSWASKVVSLIRAAACNSWQLLNFHVLYHIGESDILFLKLNILSLDSLKISHSVLKLFIQITNAVFIQLLHFSHFLLDTLHHLLLLLVVTGTGTFSH